MDGVVTYNLWMMGARLPYDLIPVIKQWYLVTWITLTCVTYGWLLHAYRMIKFQLVKRWYLVTC